MDQPVAFVADDTGQTPDGPKVEAILHRHVIERGVRALVHGGKLTAFEAGESGPITKIGKSLAEKVLHALGPGIMLAVDDVQNSHRSSAMARRRNGYGRHRSNSGELLRHGGYKGKAVGDVGTAERKYRLKNSLRSLG